MSGVYLIQRGERPDYHVAPFHPVIVCGKKRVAEWQAGWSGDGATVWSHEPSSSGSGWLTERWCGFDIDYGHVVRVLKLPDGTFAGFVHDRNAPPWTLLRGAVWWDDRPMPAWLQQAGVIYPPDSFTRQRVLDNVADDGSSGFRREIPGHWAPVIDVAQVEEARHA